MDVSKEYILMCEKAEEIQKSHIQRIGDWQIDRDDIGDKPYLITSLSRIAEKESCFPHEIWLPRQDQLQKMIEWEDKYLLKINVLNIFWLRILDKANFMLYEVSGNSMEQLWIAFVMKEKYNKVWIDGDWKTENAHK